MLQFENPSYLWALAALPVLAALFLFLIRWRRGLLGRMIDKSLTEQLAPDFSSGKSIVKHLSLLTGLAFLILALANPQVGTRIEEVKREGIDLFVAIDVSLSMKAEDIRPNRLEKAKRDVSDLLGRLQGDRVGLIVFAGDAFVQFPLTSDYSAADLFISAVDVDAVPTPGTRIASAIQLALKSFPKDVPTEKGIIVVSDGENNEGEVTEAVEEANSLGVRVYSVGMGTIEGGPIPIYNAGGQRVDYKRDRNGSIVLTKLDETTMQQIAAAAKGSYRRATSGGNEIDDLFEEISSLEKTEFGSKQITAYETKYQYPLAAAILFLFLEVLLSERRGSVLRLLKRLLPATALFCLVCLPAAGNAQTHRSLVNQGNDSYEEEKYPDAEAEYKKALLKNPGSGSATFNIGDAYYKQERFEEAGKSFQTYAAGMGGETEHSSDAFYNYGNSMFKQNKFQESVDAYKQALRLNPNDDDARHNLQLAKEKLKQQEQQQQQNKQQNKDDQKKDQDKQKQDQNQQKKDDQQKQDQQQQHNQQDKQNQQQQQPQMSQQNKIPKEQADRILDALRNSEKEIQKQIRKREGTKIRTEKDW